MQDDPADAIPAPISPAAQRALAEAEARRQAAPPPHTTPRTRRPQRSRPHPLRRLGTQRPRRRFLTAPFILAQISHGGAGV